MAPKMLQHFKSITGANLIFLMTPGLSSVR